MADEAPKAPTEQSSKKETSANKPIEEKQLDDSKINVKIYSPFKVYFNEPALSVSAENDTGPFDILPKHHRFMTLLNAGDLTVRKVQGGEQKFRIARGIMHVKQNQVIVFLDV